MDNQNQLLIQRREKAQSLADDGVKLFSNDFKHPQHIADILPQAEALEPETHAPEGVSCRIAGRVMVLRKFGKAAFFQLQDETSRIQIYARLDVHGEEQFGHFKKWDAGDIVGVEGRPFKTKTGEPSIEATELHMICKSLRPLPEKFHGLTDV
ncbi:lysine--tRNA ligase, partial [Desulfobulbus sp. F1]|nr:lysine--tRNA ligase [Desulfobulbus sp. F1]